VKALSILQPWASLIAIGAKQYETRSWQTTYRGPIAIHASKRIGPRGRDFCQDPLVARAYRSAGVANPAQQLPRSAVIATARLVAVHRTEDVRNRLSEQERTFGFYDDGRFAWELTDVVALSTSVPASGRLGLWEWDCR
jgi:hypothetical protein